MVHILIKVAMIFQESHKIYSGSNLFFRGLFFDFFKFSLFHFLEERQTPPSKSENAKVTKKMIDF